MTDRTGQQLDDYQLLRLLGQGAFGEVYLAEQIHTQTRVAVKVLTTPFSHKAQEREAILEDFLREARALFRLTHPSIVPLLDFGLEHRIPFLVMEYAPNGTLRHLHQKGEQVPLTIVNRYVQQVASALQYAHERRLIHRDVKPENMLLGQQGQVWLSDFGIAAIAHSERSLTTQEMAGTVAYMSPEQLQGKPQPASDQYSLSIAVYEWLCGVRPFQGTLLEIAVKQGAEAPPPLRGLVPVSVEIEQVVLRALAKDPARRFPTVQAFADAFAHVSNAEHGTTFRKPLAGASPSSASIAPGPGSSQAFAPPAPQQEPYSSLPPIAASPAAPTREPLPLPASVFPFPQGNAVSSSPTSFQNRTPTETAHAGDGSARKSQVPLIPVSNATTSPPFPSSYQQSQSATRGAVTSAKSAASRRFVLLGLVGLIILALTSSITWFTFHHVTPPASIHVTPPASITEFLIPTADSRPGGITAGPNGNLWFTEDYGNKIGRISPSGTITEFLIPTAQSYPIEITAGPDGNLWFTEGIGNKIGRISPNGTITEFHIPTSHSHPYGITAGPGGNLWFTEINSNKIGRISSNGTITEFHIPTAQSGPEGITAGPDGNLWFTEYAGNKIGRISHGGT
ncbi:MAG: protein kinase [Ktedonobacteraceae bacterium]|nr:protein kinase [Ktedonobacteraceae bacterium]